MRLNQFLAQCGVGSRRSVEPYILEGRVTVNDEIVTSLATSVSDNDIVYVEGKLVKRPDSFSWILLHKPAGYICSRGDDFGRDTIYDLMDESCQALHYVGRLDLQSRGLLLLTDDGNCSRALCLPSSGVERCYHAWTRRDLNLEDLERLRKGVEIEEGVFAKPLRVEMQGRMLKIVLTEGKNREIRKMLDALGHRVVDLFRISFGSLSLGNLGEGQYRPLKDKEVAALHGLVAHSMP